MHKHDKSDLDYHEGLTNQNQHRTEGLVPTSAGVSQNMCQGQQYDFNVIIRCVRIDISGKITYSVDFQYYCHSYAWALLPPHLPSWSGGTPGQKS